MKIIDLITGLYVLTCSICATAAMLEMVGVPRTLPPPIDFWGGIATVIFIASVMYCASRCIYHGWSGR